MAPSRRSFRSCSLRALPVVLPGCFIGDQLGVGFEHRFDNAEFIGAERRSGFGHFHNGVGKDGGFHFRGAPAEFDFRVYAVFFEIALRGGDEFRGDGLAFQIFRGIESSASGTASTQRTLPKLCLA